MIIECLFFQLATWILIEVTKGVSYELIVHFHDSFQSLFSSQLYFELSLSQVTCSDENEKNLGMIKSGINSERPLPTKTHIRYDTSCQCPCTQSFDLIRH